MNVTLDHVIDEAANIRTFYFAVDAPQPLDYIAGQFIELTVPGKVTDDRGNKHWFTLSSAPSDELLTITTKHNQPSSDFKTILWGLEAGAKLTMSEPMGDFVLPKDTSRPLVFIAAGIGITPFHSMLRSLVARGEKRTIKLLYAVANESEIIFQDTFRQAGVHATIVVEQASPEWGGERGRLTVNEIIGLELPSTDSLLYLSGPEPLVEKLTKDLRGHGLKPGQVITDYFPGYTQV